MFDSIRLPEKEIVAIQTTFRQHFLPSDHLWVFGSRTDLMKKGGDIDLYVETEMLDASDIIDARIHFLSSLQAIIGEQKIDLVVKQNQSNFCLPIHDVARTTGVQLV